MKIQYKAALIIALFGLGIVTLFTWAAETMNKRVVIERELNNLRNISDEVAQHIGSLLKQKVAISLTLSTSPVIKNALLQSNSEFADLSEEERRKMIKNLNNRWQEATDVNDPFIQPYITNPVAEHLKNQQEIFAGLYGEIFLTNVYGAMISTTGKLTTLAHAHKYWWKACYEDGQGRIFLDDRGFDISVKGYVLGVVIPVKADNEIIGILKCNVNLLGPLTDVIQKFSLRSLARIRIVRTGGLIVSEKGVQPLSTKLSEETISHLQSKTCGTSIIKGKDKQLVAFSPIIETLGSEKYGFGGSYKSIDHIKGNQGDAWHIVISLPENIALEASHKTTRLIFIFGILLILLVAYIALVLGRLAAAPIVGIAKIAQEIGNGALDAKATISSNDEIGSLAISINQMAEHLLETMTSKDNLEKEIELRKEKEVENVILNERLQQAQKMEAIGTLAGGIAHDFNNILAAILGYAEMARDDVPPESTVGKDLDQVLEGGNRAKDLVQQILAFSRQGEMERIPMQPASVMKDAIKMLRPSLPTTIEIKQNINPTTGLILADPTQIHQIVMNLCTNAFHAMEETGGKLGISLKETTLSTEDLVHEPEAKPGIFVQLSISDSGPGIAPETKKKIFDPYFTTKETGKGTGMGLAIVYGIAKSYGGFVSLYSEPGEDTVFHIYIPVIEKELLPEIEDVEPIPVGRDRILFIDDEKILVEMGKTMLERLGYHVTVRNNSIEALETFQNQPELFDLVITDQTMPGMTGVDIARRMIQIRPDIPIILCTGYSTVISEEKAKSMGIREFAVKPLSKKDIAVLIRKVLDKS